MRLTEYVSVRERPELLQQWDRRRNLPLLPEEIGTGSEQKVWWQCERGHEWQASVMSRVALGRGCPYCSGQQVDTGKSDLAACYPQVARLWHPTRNGVLTPDRVQPSTHKRVWWQCERGHEWQVMPLALINGSGCPYCAGKKAIPGETDLATLYPDLAEQWHPVKNGDLLTSEVGGGSTRKVWWRCERGHDYEACVYSRVQGTGCPYCSGKKVLRGFNDLATTNPELSPQWHTQLNGTLTPGDVSKGSHKAVWWECGEGHVWKAVIFSRTRQNAAKCPICIGQQKRKLKKA